MQVVHREYAIPLVGVTVSTPAPEWKAVPAASYLKSLDVSTRFPKSKVVPQLVNVCTVIQ
jgi:hypothetical protein